MPATETRCRGEQWPANGVCVGQRLSGGVRLARNEKRHNAEPDLFTTQPSSPQRADRVRTSRIESSTNARPHSMGMRSAGNRSVARLPARFCAASIGGGGGRKWGAHTRGCPHLVQTKDWPVLDRNRNSNRRRAGFENLPQPVATRCTLRKQTSRQRVSPT